MESLFFIGAILLLALAISWVFVPFILMGISSRLDKLIQLQQQTQPPPQSKAEKPPTGERVKDEDPYGVNPLTKDIKTFLIILLIIGALTALAYVIDAYY